MISADEALMKSARVIFWIMGFAVLLGNGPSLRMKAAADREGLHFFHGITQGTQYHIRYRGHEQPDLPQAVDSFLADFDRIFSNYRPDSEVSRFNLHPSTEWLPVSRALERLVAESLRLSLKTEGAFDITIGALLKLWGFGPYKRLVRSVPDSAAIAAALNQSGYRNLETRQEPPALRRKVSGLEIDLSGIAQGHAVDQVAELLQRRGIQSYMVEIGGEVLTQGEKSPSVDWRIAIEAPQREQGRIATIVRPRGQGLATSGDYRNYFEVDGQRYSHILDPRQGRPVRQDLASASILAPTVTEADAYAKVWMVLGSAEAQEKAVAWNLPSFLIIRDGFDFRVLALAGFEAENIEVSSL
jgi:thiamine biosynthesis lipoprotein